jgi:hypothetical protein
MGIYPTQTLYGPKRHNFRWGGGAKQPVKVKPEHDPRKVKAKPQMKKTIESRAQRNLISHSFKVVKKEEENEEEEEKDSKSKRERENYSED